jgi:16S rRNA (uracil1498-N3)-methyltransferase
MNRFFVSEANLEGERVVLGRERAHQIRNVLRLRPGEHIIALDNRGWEYEVVLATIGRSEVTGEVVEKREALGEPRVQIKISLNGYCRSVRKWA